MTKLLIIGATLAFSHPHAPTPTIAHRAVVHHFQQLQDVARVGTCGHTDPENAWDQPHNTTWCPAWFEVSVDGGPIQWLYDPMYVSIDGGIRIWEAPTKRATLKIVVRP